MKLAFEEQQSRYVSGSQKARVWTEQWAAKWLFCPNCGNPEIRQFPANLPVADFHCVQCGDQYELKSQKKPFGAKLANGSYDKKCERLSSASNPNLILLNYDLEETSVRNVFFIPKHFFAPAIIERRKPLGPNAKRAGWVGSNILLSRIPEAGRIHVIRDGVLVPKTVVLEDWKHTLFLRNQATEARGWLIEVMNCVEKLGHSEFTINDVYDFESQLAAIYPNNRHVKPKIRQQLQVLRDNGYLDFVARGRYKLRRKN